MGYLILFGIWSFIPMLRDWNFIFKFGGLAQLARAPALHAGGQRFDSVILHKVELAMMYKVIGSLTLRGDILHYGPPTPKGGGLQNLVPPLGARGPKSSLTYWEIKNTRINRVCISIQI